MNFIKEKELLKKWWFWLIVVVVVFGGILGGGSSNENTSKDDVKEETVVANSEAKEEVEAETAEELASDEENVEDSSDLREAFNDSLGDTKPIWKDSVRNDSTGKWKSLVVYTDKTAENYAADYYKAYFTSDEEIHIIENLYLKTAAKIVVVQPGTLDVTIYEYVDKEEHDAKLMCSGTMLGQYWVNIETGEVEEITE